MSENDRHSLTVDRRAYIIGAGGALAGLAGCASLNDDGGDGDGNGSGTTDITYYDRYEWCDDYSAAFSESSEDYSVETQVNPTTESGAYQSAIAQISAGNAPEVIGLDVVQVANFSKLGALRELESFSTGLEYYDDIFEPLREGFVTYDDTTVALPFWIDLSMYYYNKAHFEAAGLDPENPPATWDEYLSANETLGQEGDRLGTSSSFGGFFYWPTAWANGASLLNEDGTEAAVDSQEAAEAVQFWVDLHNSEYTSDLISTEWQTAHDLFVNENSSMVHSGGYALGYVRDNNPEMIENGDLGVAMLPAPSSDAERTSFLGGNTITITKQAAQDENRLAAAEEFVRWVNTEDGMSVTLDNGYFPPRSAGFDLPIAQENEDLFAPFQTALAQGTAPAMHPKFREMSTALFSEVETALTGDSTPMEALEAAAQRINSNVL